MYTAVGSLSSAQKRGSWVVDRVVGPEVLHEQDDELRDQLSRLQISSELCGNYMYMSCVCARLYSHL